MVCAMIHQDNQEATYNLRSCNTGGAAWMVDGEHFYQAMCAVHTWSVTKSFGDSHVGGVGWSLAQERAHEAIFRQIAVARARAQTALDIELQRLLDRDVMWTGDAFDGRFLSGVGFIKVLLPAPWTEEDA